MEKHLRFAIVTNGISTSLYEKFRLEMQPLGSKVVLCIIALAVIGYAQDAANINQTPRIYNGKAAKPGEFPYMAVVEYTSPSNETSICGGSIMSRMWILTAAHCIETAQKITVILGVTNVADDNEVGRVVRSGQSWYMHHNYRNTSLRFDIALIRMDAPVPFSEFINPVKLYEKERTMFVEAVVPGFGKTNTAGALSEHLQWAPMTTTDPSCFKHLNISDNLINRKAYLCAIGDSNSSPCDNDNGSPLVTEKGYQIALVSKQVQFDCHRGELVLFTKIRHYMSWMRRTIRRCRRCEANFRENLL